MRTIYHTEVRKLEGIHLSRDGVALAALLEEALGSKVVLRVKQRGRRWDLPRPGPGEQLAEALAAAGVTVAEDFDAEILVRDPVSMAPDREA